SFRQRPYARLRERRAARTHQQLRTRIVLSDGGVERGAKHVGAHDHAGAAAGRRIVDGAMAADAVIANLPRLQSPDSARQRVASKRHAQGTRKHLRKESEDRRAPHASLSHGCGEGGKRRAASCRRRPRSNCAKADRLLRSEFAQPVDLPRFSSFERFPFERKACEPREGVTSRIALRMCNLPLKTRPAAGQKKKRREKSWSS